MNVSVCTEGENEKSNKIVTFASAQIAHASACQYP